MRTIATDIAGLQFYDYRKPHPLRDDGSLIEPDVDESLELVRRPDNPRDQNAIEVWFRNQQYHLGHIPRRLARFLAPLLDDGVILDVKVTRKEDGVAWSLWVYVSGEIPYGPGESPDDDYDDDLPL